MHRVRDDEREYMGDVYGKPEKKSAVLVNWVADPEPNSPESELWIPKMGLMGMAVSTSTIF